MPFAPRQLREPARFPQAMSPYCSSLAPAAWLALQGFRLILYMAVEHDHFLQRLYHVALVRATSLSVTLLTPAQHDNVVHAGPPSEQRTSSRALTVLSVIEPAIPARSTSITEGKTQQQSQCRAEKEGG